ncbi:YaiO family outer membrane beta-barrel protein [Maribacter sp. ACAM166]|uniref:YaiO family outer membrane beta-barrel protein n=1 Tax=Maribacter sp. ACAM166 TaxID=2508996 RepID=UPI0010FD4898|nr:YaiO family outer membrane beta-barrel protein [Maribacter sp. ACAM166]TLP79219.1 YaiO family outer membrane beta-barrel protein [Maribacter sp. ACAM166]
MKNRIIQSVFFIVLSCILRVSGQDANTIESNTRSFETAYVLAYDGKTSTAIKMLSTLVNEQPGNANVKTLWASTLSWEGNYEKARSVFNDVLSNDKNNREAWISAVKNELYAKNYSIALGLVNKALLYLDEYSELERLKNLAKKGIDNTTYVEKGWYNVDSNINTILTPKNSENKANKIAITDSSSVKSAPIIRKTPVTEEEQKNRVAVNSSVTIFDQSYNPITSSSISYKRQTAYGSIIPRLNLSNRLGKNGIQLDLDLYPKIAKGFYAYLNYGYSNSELYPNHKVGGDIYYNHKSGIEFSAGGRYISFATRAVKSITNSLGYYRGNYYFSLRSYITPVPNQLTKASGNILIRKYLKDAENYMGINFGIGFSPELRQFSSGNQILAETLLYIESQRLSCEYQFTSKNNLSSYRTNIGVLRQEQSFVPGSFFYSFSAGLTYQFNF